MQKCMDRIQFEDRAEIREVMRVLEKFMEQNPTEKDNKTVNKLHDLLDIMEMEW